MNDKQNARARERRSPPFASTAGSGHSQALPPEERLRGFLDAVFREVFGDDKFRQRLVQRIQTGTVDRSLLAKLLRVLDQPPHETARTEKESVKNP